MEASVQKLSRKGYGIAGDVEVAHTIPGDEILFELTRKRRLPKKGRLLEILKPSKDRVEPRCSHARTCGGCCWQQMDYLSQLKQKELRVEKAFQQKPEAIIPSPNTWRYRNKMEFTFSENRGGQKYLGLMIAQAEPYVFNLNECHLTSPWYSEVVAQVRKWWEGGKLMAYNPPKDAGSLRYLTLREGMRTGEKMAVLNVSGNIEYALQKSEIEGFIKAVQEGVKGEISIFLRIHQTKKGKPTQFFEIHLAGKDHITEELHLKTGKLSFKISPISFFQPSTFGAEVLYDAVLSMLEEPNVIYDLYCGTGTLGMAASKKAKKVIGIELSPEAVIDAEENLKRNGVENMRLIQGDVGQVLSKEREEDHFDKPDVVIIDPPRCGLDALAIHHLKVLMPKQILYVSCNPLSQKENIDELFQSGYELKKLQPIDQFPHTYHIENIALLVRN